MKKDNILIGLDGGARLPVLDMVHKVTADVIGGALSILEWARRAHPRGQGPLRRRPLAAPPTDVSAL